MIQKVPQSLIPLIVLLNGVTTPRCQNLGLLEGPEGHGRPSSRQRFAGTSGHHSLANLIKNHRKGADYSRRGTGPAALLPELDPPRLESLYVTVGSGVNLFIFCHKSLL